MKNKLKHMLRSGQYALGGFLSIGAPAVAEVVAVGGLDFVVVDTEHGEAGFDAVININRAAMARNISTIVRITDYDKKLIGRYLDNGVDGIQAPMIETAEMAEKFCSACKFEPMGVRGSSSGRASRWGHVPQYRQTANQETMTVCMCETKLGVDNIEEIVKVPNLDVVFIGLGDLSQSMGCVGRSNAPEMVEATNHVLRACLEANVVPGIVCDGAQKAIERIQQGFRYITVLNDMRLLCKTTESITSAVHTTLPRAE